MGMAVIQPCILVSKLKKTKTRCLRYTDCLNSIKTIKQELLLTLFLVRLQNFLNCQPHVLLLSKHVIKYSKKVYERSGKIYIWSIKFS